MVQGVAHTFGDAGASVLYAGATAANNFYNMKDIWTNYGNRRWVSFFYRVASSGVSSGQECDIMDVSGGVVDSDMTVQSQYSTGNGFLGFILEPVNTGGSQKRKLLPDGLAFAGHGLLDSVRLWLGGMSVITRWQFIASPVLTWSQVSGSPFPV